MNFKFRTNLLIIIFFCVLVFLISGCSTTDGRRVDIINELKDAGCRIVKYNERFDKAISIRCKIVEF